MTSLIVTLVSIVLVAVLAVATLYYAGGGVLNNGQHSAKASTIVSAGEQVAAALSMYRTDKGHYPASLEALVDGRYLSGLPQIAEAPEVSFITVAQAAPISHGDWIYDPEVPHLAFAREALSLEVCAEINKQTNYRRMVLNTLDPGARVQCVAAGAAMPVVVFRNAASATFFPLPGAPAVGGKGVFEEVARGIDSAGSDGSGRCVFGCNPGLAEGAQGPGGSATPPAAPEPVVQAPEVEGGTVWELCTIGGRQAMCSPESPAVWSNPSITFTSVLDSAALVTISGEIYVSTVANTNYLNLNPSVDLYDPDTSPSWFSGSGGGWQPFAQTVIAAPGPLSLTATYFKDEEAPTGQDRVAIRDVSFSMAPPPVGAIVVEMRVNQTDGMQVAILGNSEYPGVMVWYSHQDCDRLQAQALANEAPGYVTIPEGEGAVSVSNAYVADGYIDPIPLCINARAEDFTIEYTHPDWPFASSVAYVNDRDALQLGGFLKVRALGQDYFLYGYSYGVGGVESGAYGWIAGIRRGAEAITPIPVPNMPTSIPYLHEMTGQPYFN